MNCQWFFQNFYYYKYPIISIVSSIIKSDFEPSLMEGSLRYNFDPLDKSEDNEIIKVMQKIGLIILLKEIKMD